MSQFSFFHWLIVIAITAGIFALRGNTGKSETPCVCKTCGNVGAPKRVTRGSIGIELVLWLCFLVPGLIYSLWRLSTRYDACSKCDSREVIPADTPIGQKLIAELRAK